MKNKITSFNFLTEKSEIQYNTIKSVNQAQVSSYSNNYNNMKKAFFILLAIVLTTSNSNAQDTEMDSREKLSFGLKAGLNYSNVYDSKNSEFKADGKVGLAGGLFVGIPIGKYIGIQPEVLLSQRGFKSDNSILGNTYSLKRTTTYLDIPLMLALKPSEFITIVAGPQYSFLVQQNDSYDNGTTTVDQQTDYKNDNVRKNTLCFTGGLDINLKHIVLGGRAGWDILNNAGDGSSNTPRYKNMWYQATIGYRF